MPALCRDCLTPLDAARDDRVCPACRGRRVVAHAELDRLTVAHLDCDAFYAAVEKRDDPTIRGKPVIVGGGRRGVVAACCYVARIYGVRSAMPMYKALELCPEAHVIRPDMQKYQQVGREVRELMGAVTPLVEPLSIDEAFLDLSGTEVLHGGWPARTLAALVRRIETEVGVTASIGLSYNKFLAKIASDLDKPRGFAVIGEGDALDFLAEQPVSLLWGVGKALRGSLESDGITRIGQLRAYEESDLMRRYGSIGRRLYRFAHGEDAREVEPESAAKSISAETTFDDDIADPDYLAVQLWRLSEKVARRLKRAGLAGGNVTLKLKQADFRLLTRTRQLSFPTQLAEEIYRGGLELLTREVDGRRFRLLGIGAGKLGPADAADQPDLLDPDRTRRIKLEGAIDAVRAKFGDRAVGKGRGFRRDS